MYCQTTTQHKPHTGMAKTSSLIPFKQRIKIEIELPVRSIRNVRPQSLQKYLRNLRSQAACRLPLIHDPPSQNRIGQTESSQVYGKRPHPAHWPHLSFPG